MENPAVGAVFDGAQALLTGGRMIADTLTSVNNALEGKPQTCQSPQSCTYSRRNDGVSYGLPAQGGPQYMAQAPYRPAPYAWGNGNSMFQAATYGNGYGQGSYAGYPGITNPNYGKTYGGYSLGSNTINVGGFPAPQQPAQPQNNPFGWTNVVW